MFSKPALLLSFCACLAGCSQDADFFSGYKINGGNTGFLVDVGDYRVGAGDIKALPKYKIPNTFYVTFSWSPEKARQIHRKLGYRRATERDFNRIFAGPSTNKLTKAPNQEAMNKVRQRVFHGDYEHIVAPNIAAAPDGVASRLSFRKPKQNPSHKSLCQKQCRAAA